MPELSQARGASAGGGKGAREQEGSESRWERGKENPTPLSKSVL